MARTNRQFMAPPCGVQPEGRQPGGLPEPAGHDQAGRRRSRGAGTFVVTQHSSRRRVGFTLIELLLVMALLAAVISVGAPSLSRFFRGRELDSEGHRLLALTRYGQSQAVSLGIPMILWVDRLAGTYGLRPQAGYAPVTVGPRPRTDQSLGNPEPKEYHLANGLRIELALGEPARTRIVSIRFTPDGAIDDGSFRGLVIRQEKGDWIALMQSPNQLSYELTQNAYVQPSARR